MSNLRRYTTPVHELLVKGVDLTSAAVFVTYKQGATVVTFDDNEITKSLEGEDTRITVPLSQADTAGFSADDTFLKDGTAEVQVNWLLNGKREATGIDTIIIERNLLERVIT